MYITTFGSKHFLGQLPIIIQSLRDLGHIVDTPSNAPELIYSNDLGGYEESYQTWLKYNRAPKLILNCQDLPFHVLDFNKVLERYRYYLNLADKVTTISYKVKDDIKNYLNIDAYVIYQPIRNIYHIPHCEKRADFFINGRVLDSNKRGFLAGQLAKKMNKSLVCAGSDYLPNAYNVGVLKDSDLCNIYNYSKITLAFGRIEGLGMQIPESIICNTPIITLSDNLTNFEFCPLEMICDPNIQSIEDKANDIFTKYEYYQDICKIYAQKYSTQFSPKSIASNIVSVYNSII